MDAIKYDLDLPVEYVPIQAITVPVTSTSSLALTGDVLLCGYSLTESTGAAPAAFSLFDGQDATGQLLATVNLSAGQSVVDALPFPGLYCTRGVFVSVVLGSVSGVVWVRDV